jgi:hypothetical protein
VSVFHYTVDNGEQMNAPRENILATIPKLSPNTPSPASFVPRVYLVLGLIHFGKETISYAGYDK